MSDAVEETRLYVNQYLANVQVNEERALEISQKIATLIEDGKLKLIDFVKSLGDYLTAEDDLLRPKATSCLARTIKNLSSSSLNPNDVQVLNTFFINKTTDLKSTKEALFGLSALVDKENFGTSNIKPLLISFESYDSKHHLAASRHLTFEIFDKVYTKFAKYLQKFLNDLFVKSFIHIATGEKDPRNLLLSFNLSNLISQNFKVDKFQDDLFDNLFCYFPISFRAPKDDPYQITSDQLKSALRQGIASTSSFAKDAYPNLLEKLSSTSPTVKLDVVLTLNACIENYGYQSLVENWIEIWNGLKFEILHADQADDEAGLFPAVLNSFKAIGKVLSTDEDYFNVFFEKISQELKPNINNQKHIKETVAILGAIASSSTYAFNAVVHSTLIILLNNNNDLDVKRQRILISNIGVITSAYIEVFGTFEDLKNSTEGNSLLAHKDEILIVLGKALMGSSKVEVSLRTVAIAELTKISTLANFLTDSELSLVVQYFTESILVDDNEYIYNSGIGGLIQISKINTPLLLEIAFPTLISLLPDDESSNVNIEDQEKPKEKIFEILSAISINEQTTNFLITKLYEKLVIVGSKDDNIKYSYLIASTLKTIIENAQATKQYSTDSYLKNIYKDLSKLILTNKRSLYDINVLDLLTDVLKLIVVYSSKDLHEVLFKDTLSLFTGGDLSESEYYTGIQPFNLLDEQTKLVNFFSKISAAVDKSVILPGWFASQSLQFIQKTNFDEDSTKIGYLQLLSLAINKWTFDVSEFESLPLDSGINIESFTWITKGLILKIDMKSEIFTDRLLELLSMDVYGTMASKSFEVLVADLSIFDKFKKINNNNVRLLYKQKFVQLLIPKIVAGFTKSDSLSVKSHYLTALSYILKHCKREIIVPHLSAFLPLLLQSLPLPNSEVRFSTVQTLLSSVDEIPELTGKHLQTLIPSLLDLAQADKEKNNTPDVRLVSLNCLQSLTFSIPLEKLVQYQTQILKRLESVLDDKKRNVRKGAVDARQAYYELGRSPIE